MGSTLIRKDPARAVPMLEDSVRLEQGLGNPRYTAASQYLLALALVVSGETEPAVPLLENCLVICEARGVQALRSSALALLGVSEWLRGQLEAATVRICEAIQIKLDIEDALGLAYAIEVLAWIAAAEEDPDRAARLFGASHQLWQPLGTYLGGSHFYETWHGRYERQARDALGDCAFQVAEKQGSNMNLEQAIAYACGEPDGASKPEPEFTRAEPQVLTRREAEIAGLIAQGMRNKDIASKLVISTRTAESHVENILAKLGYTSRTQIATWFTTQQSPPDMTPGSDST